MALNITPISNRGEREKGLIVYPVYSRRAKGLSIGINLFPDKKSCLFNCPYCEVFPFSNNVNFSIDQMADDLRTAITAAREQNIPIKDVCFSGNGEPTLSPVFPQAFNLVYNILKEMATVNDALLHKVDENSTELVVITNGTGLLQEPVFSFLVDAVQVEHYPTVNLWLKLDAGTSAWYQKINRSNISYEKLYGKIKDFVFCTPVTIQTMLCVINNEPPPENEAKVWETLVCDLAKSAKNGTGFIRKVQIYGKARAAPEDPSASQLPADYLEERAMSLREALGVNGVMAPVEVYL
jgi:histidinol dehydrogenase